MSEVKVNKISPRSGTDVTLGDSGDYIKTWNVSGLAEPTAEQLISYEDVANTEEALNVILSNRRNAYPAIVDQLDDIYHNGIDGWKATIKVTKDKYPKS